MKKFVLLLIALFVIGMSNSIQAQRKAFGWVECYQGYQEREAEHQRFLDSLVAAGVDIDVLVPVDPNEIVGTSGYDAVNSELLKQWVSSTQSLPYTIYFENDPEVATAAAQRVEVRHQIHALGNLATFGIGTFGFGEHVFSVDGSPFNYQKRLDLTESMGIYVDVVAGVDVVHNEVFWIFQSIDPATGLAPLGAEQGFLPVNDENHSGEGFVTFAVKPKTLACSTGDIITASASIVFDVNEAISTNVWSNTIDALPPVTHLTGNETEDDEILLQFSGNDDEGGCGIKQYKLYVSDNYAPFKLYDVYLIGTEPTFPTEYNHCYRFYSLGEDNVGNVEELKSEPDFEYGNYNLSVAVAAMPEEGGTVTGAGTFVYDSQVTVTAVPSAEYVFSRWTVNGSPVSDNPTYTFSIHEDVELVAQFELANLVVAQYDLYQGWNWWSTYIHLDGESGLAQLEESLDAKGEYIKSQRNGFVSSDGEEWYGNLRDLNSKNMYMIQTSEPVQLAMSGLLIDASAFPIDIHSGWNWVGYPLSTSHSVNDALSLLEANEGDALKSKTQICIYDGEDGWFGTLRNMIPGQGYMLNAQNEHTLVYNTNYRGGLETEIKAKSHWSSKAFNYADNMCVVAAVELDGEELHSESYQVAAFCNGTSLGSTPLLYNARRDRYFALLLVPGEEGMKIDFRLYKTEIDYEYPEPAKETYLFAINDMVGSLDEPVTLHFGINRCAEESAPLRLFPNPVKKNGLVRLDIPETSSNVRVEIYNVLDVLVNTKTFAGNCFNVGDALSSGTYILRVDNGAGQVYYGKLIVE